MATLTLDVIAVIDEAEIAAQMEALAARFEALPEPFGEFLGCLLLEGIQHTAVFDQLFRVDVDSKTRVAGRALKVNVRLVPNALALDAFFAAAVRAANGLGSKLDFHVAAPVAKSTSGDFETSTGVAAPAVSEG